MTAGTLERVYRMRDDDLTTSEYTLITYLARTSRTDDGEAIPVNFERAGRACRMRARQVERSLEELAESGYLDTYAPSIGDGDVDLIVDLTAWWGPEKVSRP